MMCGARERKGGIGKKPAESANRKKTERPNHESTKERKHEKEKENCVKSRERT
jgi:hypothetical protein